MYDTSKSDIAALDQLSETGKSFIRAILACSQDSVELISLAGLITYANGVSVRAMGFTDLAEVTGKSWAELWPEASQPTAHVSLQQARLGQTATFEARYLTAKGDGRWWHVTLTPLTDANGTTLCFLALSHDISERVLRQTDTIAHAEALQRELDEKTALLEQRAFLQREIDHRVKNSLAQVAAILRMQGRRSSPETRAALEEAARRVGTVARVHEQLQVSGDMRSVLLRPLIAHLTTDFATTTARTITFEALDNDDLPITSDRATALMIIVSELLANAVRHGGTQGEILVSLDIGAEGEAAISVINPIAKDCPLPQEPVFSGGLGTMISQSYASNIGAEIGWRSGLGMMRAMVKFPRQS